MSVLSIYAPGHIDPYDSYGLIACELLRHLDAAGVYVNAFSRGNRNHNTQPADIARLTDRPIHPSFGGLFLGYPTGYAEHGALSGVGRRVAVTMFESSKIPGAWIEPLNEMAAVIVPSLFCRDVFENCGVNPELLHVVPLGIGEAFQPVTRTTDRPLTFLAFMDRGARKGGHVALQAFIRAFGDRDDVRLVLKSRDIGQRVNVLNNNIEYIQQDMTDTELAALYGRCDVLINANKGEGFGLIPREFAATGGISLVTNWGGTADDIDQWGYPLPYTLEPADWRGNKTLEGQDLGVWAAHDYDEIADTLLHVADDYEWMKEEAAENAPYVRWLYSWQKFSLSVLQIFEGINYGNRNPTYTILA